MLSLCTLVGHMRYIAPLLLVAREYDLYEPLSSPGASAPETVRGQEIFVSTNRNGLDRFLEPRFRLTASADVSRSRDRERRAKIDHGFWARPCSYFKRHAGSWIILCVKRCG